MVNSGSFDSDGYRNGKARCTQANDAATSSQFSNFADDTCKNDCSKSADTDLPSDESAIEPTPSKTEINSSILTDASSKHVFPAKDEKASLCCSLPLDKLQGTLMSPSPTPDNSVAEDKLKSTRKLLCLYCDRSFVSANLRQKHVERVHTVKPTRRVSARRQNQLSVTTCVHCDKLNASEHTLNDLFQHFVQEHPTKYFGCLSCEERFLSSTHLVNHNSSKHNVGGKTNIKRHSPTSVQIEEIDVNSLQDSDDVPLKITRSKLRNKTDDPLDVEDNSNLQKRKKKSKLKELRNKKISVKTSKIALKRSKRLQAQTKESDSQKKRRDKKLVNTNKSEASNSTKQPEKTKPICVNPYPEFDNFYRVKKITDHSIDNLKISSLTFDDVFDKAFFTRIKCNIEENLLHHIDGKLFKNEESESRISNFEKISTNPQEIQSSTSENYGCELSLNAITPVPSLSINSQFGEDFESQIEYGSKPSKKKTQTKSDEVHYKYFTRRKYQACILQQKENRDLSKLDMWTQMVVKERQEKLVNEKKNAKEIQEYTSGQEYINKMKKEELNRILDRRGPFEDLKEEASKKAAFDKLNSSSDSDISQEVFTDVRAVLNEILNKVFEFVKEDDFLPETTSKEVDDRQIPAYLDLRRKDSSTQEEIDKSDRIALICSSQETENYELPTNTVRAKNELVELTGEWARSRMYICAACGGKFSNMKYLLEHRSIYHQNVWVQSYEFVGNQSKLYRHLSIPGLGKVGFVETTVPCKQWRRSDARKCTKCGKQCNSLGELHRHVLECGGDWTWMLARKKCKYRPYGARSRRKRRGLGTRIQNKQKTEPPEKKNYKKPLDGPRQRPSDADTIQRMLANLPAKRSRRSLISLRDVVFKSRKTKQGNKTQAAKVKCGKTVCKKQKTEINKPNISQQCNRRSLRSLNKVLSSRILDLNSSLIVKRKLKAIRSQRSTKSNPKTKDNNNTVSEEIDDEVDSADTALLLPQKRKSPKKATSPSEASKSATKSSINESKNTLTKKMLSSRLNIKNFFPVKKKSVTSAKKNSSLDQDNIVHSNEKGPDKPSKKSIYLENSQYMKKSKRGGLKGFVRALSLRKRNSKDEEHTEKIVSINSDTTDVVKSSLPEASKKGSRSKTKKSSSPNKLDKVSPETSKEPTNSVKDLSKKRKLQRGFRNVINKVKKLKTEKTSHKSEDLTVKNASEETSAQPFLEEKTSCTDTITTEKVATSGEVKENIQEKEDHALIVDNLLDPKESAVVPEVNNEANTEEKVVQVSHELTCDNEQTNLVNNVLQNNVAKDLITTVSNSSHLDNLVAPVTIDTNLKPKSVPLVSPNVKGKIRKPNRGLNDCIAMLTSKLQQKDEKTSSLESLFSTSSTTSMERAESRLLSESISPPIRHQKAECILKIPTFRATKSPVVEETALDLSKKSFSSPNLLFPHSSDIGYMDTTINKVIEGVIEHKCKEVLTEKFAVPTWTSVDDIIQQVVQSSSSSVFSKPSNKKNTFSRRTKVDDTIDYVVHSSSNWFEIKNNTFEEKTKLSKKHRRKKNSDDNLIKDILFGKDKLIIAPSSTLHNALENSLIAKIRENESKISKLSTNTVQDKIDNDLGHRKIQSSCSNPDEANDSCVTKEKLSSQETSYLIQNTPVIDNKTDCNAEIPSQKLEEIDEVVSKALNLVESDVIATKINAENQVKRGIQNKDIEDKVENPSPATNENLHLTDLLNHKRSNVNGSLLTRNIDDNPLLNNVVQETETPKRGKAKGKGRNRKDLKQDRVKLATQPVIETCIDDCLNIKIIPDVDLQSSGNHLTFENSSVDSSSLTKKQIGLTPENEPLILENKVVEQTSKLFPSDSEDEVPLAVIAKQDENDKRKLCENGKVLQISKNDQESLDIKGMQNNKSATELHSSTLKPKFQEADLDIKKGNSSDDSYYPSKDIVENLTTDSLKENIEQAVKKNDNQQNYPCNPEVKPPKTLKIIRPIRKKRTKFGNTRLRGYKRKKQFDVNILIKPTKSKNDSLETKKEENSLLDLIPPYTTAIVLDMVEPSKSELPKESDLPQEAAICNEAMSSSNESDKSQPPNNTDINELVKIPNNPQRTRRKSKSSKKIDKCDNDLFKDFSLVINKKTKRIPPSSIVDDSVCDDVLDKSINLLVKSSEVSEMKTEETNEHLLNDSVEEMDMEIEDIPVNTSIIERDNQQIITIKSYNEKIDISVPKVTTERHCPLDREMEIITTRKSPRKKNVLELTETFHEKTENNTEAINLSVELTHRGSNIGQKEKGIKYANQEISVSALQNVDGQPLGSSFSADDTAIILNNTANTLTKKNIEKDENNAQRLKNPMEDICLLKTNDVLESFLSIDQEPALSTNDTKDQMTDKLFQESGSNDVSFKEHHSADEDVTIPVKTLERLTSKNMNTRSNSKKRNEELNNTFPFVTENNYKNKLENNESVTRSLNNYREQEESTFQTKAITECLPKKPKNGENLSEDDKELCTLQSDIDREDKSLSETPQEESVSERLQNDLSVNIISAKESVQNTDRSTEQLLSNKDEDKLENYIEFYTQENNINEFYSAIKASEMLQDENVNKPALNNGEKLIEISPFKRTRPRKSRNITKTFGETTKGAESSSSKMENIKNTEEDCSKEHLQLLDPITKRRSPRKAKNCQNILKNVVQTEETPILCLESTTLSKLLDVKLSNSPKDFCPEPTDIFQKPISESTPKKTESEKIEESIESIKMPAFQDSFETPETTITKGTLEKNNKSAKKSTVNKKSKKSKNCENASEERTELPTRQSSSYSQKSTLFGENTNQDSLLESRNISEDSGFLEKSLERSPNKKKPGKRSKTNLKHPKLSLQENKDSDMSLQNNPSETFKTSKVLLEGKNDTIQSVEEISGNIPKKCMDEEIIQAVSPNLKLSENNVSSEAFNISQVLSEEIKKPSEILSSESVLTAGRPNSLSTITPLETKGVSENVDKVLTLSENVKRGFKENKRLLKRVRQNIKLSKNINQKKSVTDEIFVSLKTQPELSRTAKTADEPTRKTKKKQKRRKEQQPLNQNVFDIVPDDSLKFDETGGEETCGEITTEKTKINQVQNVSHLVPNGENDSNISEQLLVDTSLLGLRRSGRNKSVGKSFDQNSHKDANLVVNENNLDKLETPYQGSILEVVSKSTIADCRSSDKLEEPFKDTSEHLSILSKLTSEPSPESIKNLNYEMGKRKSRKNINYNEDNLEKRAIEVANSADTEENKKQTRKDTEIDPMKKNKRIQNNLGINKGLPDCSVNEKEILLSQETSNISNSLNLEDSVINSISSKSENENENTFKANDSLSAEYLLVKKTKKNVGLKTPTKKDIRKKRNIKLEGENITESVKDDKELKNPHVETNITEHKQKDTFWDHSRKTNSDVMMTVNISDVEVFSEMPKLVVDLEPLDKEYAEFSTSLVYSKENIDNSCSNLSESKPNIELNATSKESDDSNQYITGKDISKVELCQEVSNELAVDTKTTKGKRTSKYIPASKCDTDASESSPTLEDLGYKRGTRKPEKRIPEITKQLEPQINPDISERQENSFLGRNRRSRKNINYNEEKLVNIESTKPIELNFTQDISTSHVEEFSGNMKNTKKPCKNKKLSYSTEVLEKMGTEVTTADAESSERELNIGQTSQILRKSIDYKENLLTKDTLDKNNDIVEYNDISDRKSKKQTKSKTLNKSNKELLKTDHLLSFQMSQDSKYSGKLQTEISNAIKPVPTKQSTKSDLLYTNYNKETTTNTEILNEFIECQIPVSEISESFSLPTEVTARNENSIPKTTVISDKEITDNINSSQADKNADTGDELGLADTYIEEAAVSKQVSKFKKPRKNIMDIDVANILDIESSSEARRSSRRKKSLNCEQPVDLGGYNMDSTHSHNEFLEDQLIDNKNSLCSIEPHAFTLNLENNESDTAEFDLIKDFDDNKGELADSAPYEKEAGPNNLDSDSNESVPLLDRMTQFFKNLKNKPVVTCDNLETGTFSQNAVCERVPDYVMSSNGSLPAGSVSAADEAFKNTESENFVDKSDNNSMDGLLPLNRLGSMEDLVLESKSVTQTVKNKTKVKKRKVKRSKLNESQVSECNNSESVAENVTILNSDPKAAESLSIQSDQKYQLSKITIKSLLMTSATVPKSDGLPLENRTFELENKTFGTDSKASNEVKLKKTIPGSKNVNTSNSKTKGKRRGKKLKSVGLLQKQLLDKTLQENSDLNLPKNKFLLGKNLNFTALKNVLSTIAKPNKKNEQKGTEDMFSKINPLTDIITSSEIDIAPVLDEIDKSLESEDIYDFNEEITESVSSNRNRTKIRSRSCPKSEFNIDDSLTNETSVNIQHKEVLPQVPTRVKSKRSAKVKALENIHEKAATHVNVASQGALDMQSRKCRRRSKSLNTLKDDEIGNLSRENRPENYNKISDTSITDVNNLFSFQDGFSSNTSAAKHESIEKSSEDNKILEYAPVKSDCLVKTPESDKIKQNINESNKSQENLESDNQIDHLIDAQELRRSRRGSRKVASYNENDLIDPLIDALENRRNRSTRKDKSAEKHLAKTDVPKDLPTEKPKLNSEELFDLLKSSSYENENLNILKPRNSFLENLNELNSNTDFQDIRDEDFGNILEKPSLIITGTEKLKDIDKIYEFTEDSPENTEQVKEFGLSKRKHPTNQENVLSESKLNSVCNNSENSLSSYASKEKDVELEKSNYCEICKKTFIRTENLIKHKTTLTHISKLSELEAKEAEERARLENEKQTIEKSSDSLIKAPDSLKDEINIRDILQQSTRIQSDNVPRNSPSVNNNQPLNLVDIISDVLNKPVLENFNSEKHGYTEMTIQSTDKTDIRRYKSLGERKSFESESQLSLINTPLPESYLQPAMSKTTILENQIHLLENIIGNKLESLSANKAETENNFIDEISSCSNNSNISAIDNNSCVSNRSAFNLNSENIRANSNNGFIKPVQYEEISEDSANARIYEDPKLRKTLNRDEELFLECCSLLKSGSEVSNSNYSKNLKKPLDHFKEANEPELLENKKLIQTVEEAHEYSDNSRTPTPLGDTYDDEASNSNTISSNWNLKSEKPMVTNRSFSFQEVVNKEEAGISFGEVLTQGLRNQFECMPKSDERTNDVLQEVQTSRNLVKYDRKDDSDCSTTSKKISTKGARKIFEGLRVSIPTEDLNLDVLTNSLMNKKPLSSSENQSTNKPRSTRKSKPVKKSQVGSNLLFKVNKKKPSTQTNSTTLSKKEDIYNFEETQDNTDVFTKPFLKDVKITAPENTDKTGSLDSDNESLGYADSIGADAKSVSSVSSISAMSAKKPEVTPENITKKKYKIMGKIFRNAAKSKMDEIDEELRNIPEIPEIDNLELVQNYVDSCQRIKSPFLPPPPPPPLDEVPKKPKMTEEEMNLLFDQLLGKEINQLKPEKSVSKVVKSRADCKTGEVKKKINKIKNRKRTRLNSESSDDEFNINRTAKKRTNKKNNQEDSGINLELELKECIGVASRKSQRKCTSGKQNVLVEYWSSDEEAFEAMLNSQKVKAKKDEEKKQTEPKECINEELPEKEPNPEVVEATTEKPVKPKPVRRKNKSPFKKLKTIGNSETGGMVTTSSNRRKRAAANPLYHWSSSSEDESQSLIEIKPIREEDDEEDRPVQHGWIVGDSPKKLVTMLALTKGKKTDIDSVKEQGKRRTSNTVS